jgi:hypothetical protein
MLKAEIRGKESKDRVAANVLHAMNELTITGEVVRDESGVSTYFIGMSSYSFPSFNLIEAKQFTQAYLT